MLTEQQGKQIRNYTYDSTGQLIDVDWLMANGTGSGSSADLTSDPNDYVYDANGNRANSGYVTGTGNRTLADGVRIYVYDAAGNRVQETVVATGETWVYSYDHLNHLTRVDHLDAPAGNSLGRVDYGYDVFGNRISRVERDGNGDVITAESFAWDLWKTADQTNVVGNEHGDIWADLTTSGQLKTRRIFGNNADELIARIDANQSVYWYLTDRQGSVVGLANSTGQLVREIVYDGYGHVVSETNASVADRYQYTGREYDAAGGGIYFLRDRVLSQDLTQFLTPDRLSYAVGDANLYRYVGNSFANGTDPSGMALRDWFGGSGKILGDLFEKTFPNEIQDKVNQRVQQIEDVTVKLIAAIGDQIVKPLQETMGEVSKSLAWLDHPSIQIIGGWTSGLRGQPSPAPTTRQNSRC